MLILDVNAHSSVKTSTTADNRFKLLKYNKVAQEGLISTSYINKRFKISSLNANLW